MQGHVFGMLIDIQQHAIQTCQKHAPCKSKNREFCNTLIISLWEQPSLMTGIANFKTPTVTLSQECNGKRKYGRIRQFAKFVCGSSCDSRYRLWVLQMDFGHSEFRRDKTKDAVGIFPSHISRPVIGEHDIPACGSDSAAQIFQCLHPLVVFPKKIFSQERGT